MKDLRFDIIVTVWNRKGYTARTLASLVDSGAVDMCDRLIIVDNCSTEEGMYEAMDSVYRDTPGVSGKIWLLRRAKNDGWATAVNDALGLSRAPYLLLVNNDVEFEHNFVAEAFETIAKIEACSNRKVGILSLWRHIHHGDQKDGLTSKDFVETDNSPAVAWLMPKTAMIEVGMLNEHGPCLTKGGNGEDTSYVMKMKEKGFWVGSPKPDLAKHIDGY